MSEQNVTANRASSPGVGRRAEPAEGVEVGRSFRVVRRINHKRVVLLGTDDGLEAEVFLQDLRRRERQNRMWDYSLRIEGVHPSHDYDADGMCTRCNSCRNGSYGSHFPCGFEFKGSLQMYMDEWRAEHDDNPEDFA